MNKTKRKRVRTQEKKEGSHEIRTEHDGYSNRVGLMTRNGKFPKDQCRGRERFLPISGSTQIVNLPCNSFR